MGQALEEAKKQAAEDLKQARDQSQALLKEAREEGMKTGATQAEQLKQKLGKLKDLYASELSQDLLRNALEASYNLVHAELNSAPNGLIQFVKAALQSVPEVQEVRIRANPDDVAILRKHKTALINLLQRAKDIDIREDKQVSDGIILQTEVGVIDAQLKTQIEEITRVLGL